MKFRVARKVLAIQNTFLNRKTKTVLKAETRFCRFLRTFIEDKYQLSYNLAGIERIVRLKLDPFQLQDLLSDWPDTSADIPIGLFTSPQKYFEGSL